MIAVVVNTVMVFIGASIGLIARKGIPERLTDRIFQALALFVAYVGITGALGGKNTIVILLSLAIGTLLGELADFDRMLNRFAGFIESKVVKNNKSSDNNEISTKDTHEKGTHEEDTHEKDAHEKDIVEDLEKSALDETQVQKKDNISFAEAFVTTSLLQCVGAYILVAGMKAGLEGDNSMIYSKTALDFLSSIVLAASMGAGVLLAPISIFVVTGAVVLLAQLIEPLLGAAVIADMVSVGSLIIIAQALNMLKVTDIKIMNMTPAMFLPIGLVPLYNWITGLF